MTSPPSRYRRADNLATIGCKSVLLDLGRIRLSGLLARLIWGGFHIFFLIGFRNPMIVVLRLRWSYFTSERGTRLTIGAAGTMN